MVGAVGAAKHVRRQTLVVVVQALEAEVSIPHPVRSLGRPSQRGVLRHLQSSALGFAGESVPGRRRICKVGPHICLIELGPDGHRKARSEQVVAAACAGRV